MFLHVDQRHLTPNGKDKFFWAPEECAQLEQDTSWEPFRFTQATSQVVLKSLGFGGRGLGSIVHLPQGPSTSKSSQKGGGCNVDCTQAVLPGGVPDVGKS